MASFNKVVLIGRLTRDPELRYTPSGAPVAHFTLAVDRRAGKDKERETDFIDIVAWNKLAEICQQYLGKGRMVAVDGRLQIRNYETQDGQKRKAVEVVANDMQILDRPAGKPEDAGMKTAAPVGVAAAPGPAPAEEETNLGDDIPF